MNVDTTLKNKRVLVNGCSFSRGPISWPYCLQQQVEFDLVNLALSAAGNTYIHNSTISELSHRPYDFVFIMWTGLQRNDIQVRDIGLFDECVTSRKQSLTNDWDGKVVWPVNDQDYVEKNWVFVGMDNEFIQRIKFSEYIKYRSRENETYQSLLQMVTLQAVLKQLNMPYVFSYFKNYTQELEQHQDLYKLLDQSCICRTENITDLAGQLDSYDIDGYHPGVEANQQWATTLINFINAKTT
jgi:hypothetical protein